MKKSASSKFIKSIMRAGILISFCQLNSCSSSAGSEEEYARGLNAQYSNGANVVETVIFHGWGADCGETENNLYMGKCTPVDESPLDWAWGNNFTTTWTGFIHVPQPGEYTFSAWVDGTVYFVINDTVIADFNTVGSSFSKSLNFTSADWYPVLMTFTANGGSNYMHLGWVKPGADYETIPAENWGHE